jgi:hypothetical protein
VIDWLVNVISQIKQMTTVMNLKIFSLLTTCVILNSCSVNSRTVRKTERNYDFIKETAEIFIDKNYSRSELKDISDDNLKERLKEIDVSWVDVTTKNHYYYPDSVVVFSRWGQPIAVVEIMYDYSKQKRDLSSEKNGFILVKDKIYYRKRTWQLS